jgi:hypothetical protein
MCLPHRTPLLRSPLTTITTITTMSGLEVIEGLASCLQLLSQANSAREFISDCRKKIKSSPYALDHMISETQDVAKVMDAIDWSTITDSGLLQSSIQRCAADCVALVKLLVDIRNTKGRRVRKGLTWKYREGEIATIQTSLERHKNSLNHFLTVHGFHRMEQLWRFHSKENQRIIRQTEVLHSPCLYQRYVTNSLKRRSFLSCLQEISDSWDNNISSSSWKTGSENQE